MTTKLSKKSKELLEDFSSSAQNWGYIQSEGDGRQTEVSEKDFNNSYKQLETHILKLENTIRKLNNERT